MPLVTEAVGFLASLVSFLVLLPQAVRIHRDRRDPAALATIAVATQAMLLTNSLLWAVYATLIGSLWVGAPVVVNAPITCATIVLALRARRELSRQRPVVAARALAAAPACEVPLAGPLPEPVAA